MIECKEIIAASNETLFGISQNYEIRADWDPFPESYKFINGNEVNKGLQLQVLAKNGYSMVVEYVSYTQPRIAAIKMISGPWFVKEFAGSWGFKHVDDHKCIVTFKYNVVGNPRWISPILSYIFKRTTRKRLLALKKYAEQSDAR